MKIECPSCRLAGKINELELPPGGRRITCPRCKSDFQVEKPPPPVGSKALRNSCPSCHYATFTEEMFADCPKCGMSAEDYQVLSRKQREREQTLRDQEALNRSFRNPDLVKVAKEESVAEPVRAAQAVELTARLCLVLGGALLCYGVLGLANYYQKDWQAVLSEAVLEPVSRFFVFFSLGLVPWLVTLFSLHFVWAAYQFLELREGSPGRLAQGAWAGIAVVVSYEGIAFIKWARVSSSTPSLSYYAVGVLSSLFMAALLGAPFLVLLWFLKSEVITREFKKAQILNR